MRLIELLFNLPLLRRRVSFLQNRIEILEEKLERTNARLWALIARTERNEAHRSAEFQALNQRLVRLERQAEMPSVWAYHPDQEQ
jgi:tetrahydromethanopterin S-methyltransferase subunit G